MLKGSARVSFGKTINIQSLLATCNLRIRTVKHEFASFHQLSIPKASRTFVSVHNLREELLATEPGPEDGKHGQFQRKTYCPKKKSILKYRFQRAGNGFHACRGIMLLVSRFCLGNYKKRGSKAPRWLRTEIFGQITNR